MAFGKFLFFIFFKLVFVSLGFQVSVLITTGWRTSWGIESLVLKVKKNQNIYIYCLNWYGIILF